MTAASPWPYAEGEKVHSTPCSCHEHDQTAARPVFQLDLHLTERLFYNEVGFWAYTAIGRILGNHHIWRCIYAVVIPRPRVQPSVNQAHFAEVDRLVA